MASLGAMSVEITADTSGLQRGTTEARGELSRMDTQADRSSQKLASLGKVAAAAGAAIVGLGAGGRVLNTLVEFDKAVTDLQATSRATTGELKAMEDQARALGATTQFSAMQVTEAQRFLSQAGFDTNEILASTADTLKLATAGNLDIAQAADIASNALGGMGLETKELSRIVDVMAESASSSNTNVQQLASAFSRSAPIASKAGVSVEQLAAAIGVLSDSGIQAERAGTGMISIMRQLSNVVPQAEKVLAKYGLTVEDVDVQSVGLSGALKAIGEAGLTSGDAIKVFGSEAAAAGITLSNMTDKLEQQTARLDDAKGSATEMANIVGGSLTNASKGFASAVSEAALQAGDNGLNGALKSLIVSATGMTHAYTGMLDEFADANNLTSEFTANIKSAKAAIEAFATVASAGALASFAPTMAAAAGSVANAAKATRTLNDATYKTVSGFAGIGGTVRKTSSAITAFGVASRIALGPWGLLIAAVGSAAATFISTREEAEDLTEKIDEQAKYVRKATEDYKELNAQGREMFWTKSQQDLLGFSKQMFDIDKRIRGLKDSMSSVDSGTRQDIRQQIERLRDEREKIETEYEKIKAAQAKIFEVGMPKKWENPEEDEEEKPGGKGGGVDQLQQQLEAAKRANMSRIELARDTHKKEVEIYKKSLDAKKISLEEFNRLSVESAKKLESISKGGGKLANLREMTQERLQIVRDAGKSELQLQRDKHKEELDILSDARQQKIIGDKEYTELAIQSASRLEEFQKGQLERERERIAGRLETLQQAGKTEQEMMREKHATDLEILREALEQELISKQEYGQLAVESAARMEEQISEKKRREAENRARTEQWAEDKIQNMKMQTAQMAVGLLGNIASESKAAAIAQIALNKGLQIAQIIQNTATAKMRAMAELGPIAGPPAAASIAAMGAAQVGIAAASGLAQAASAGGGGNGGTSGVSSAVSSGQRQQQAYQEQQEKQTQRTLMVQGDFSPNQLFTGDTVRGLIDAIAEQQKDGYTVVV